MTNADLDFTARECRRVQAERLRSQVLSMLKKSRAEQLERSVLAFQAMLAAHEAGGQMTATR